jgi:hypothetical protein
MAILHRNNIGFAITPPPPTGTRLSLDISPQALYQMGFNLPVEIATASAFRKPPINAPLSSMVVMVHFDTGAGITSIDISLAKYLNLMVIGHSENHTASGTQVMPNFAIDISFPNTKLSPFFDLRIGSCKLKFDLARGQKNPNNPQNFGMLLGRDIMTRWNIVWNGPTSTVIVAD